MRKAEAAAAARFASDNGYSRKLSVGPWRDKLPSFDLP
jgi:hypothetical protein